MFRLIVPLAILLVLAGILRWQSEAHRARTAPALAAEGRLRRAAAAVAVRDGGHPLRDRARRRRVATPRPRSPTRAAIVELEQSTGLFFEQGLQTWAMGQRVLIDFANFMYVNSHFVMTTTVLVWLYLRHNERFYFVRNMFMVAMGLALVGYLLMPTAPPRFFPELGLRRHDRLLREREARLGARGALLQPLRGGAEHARRLLADDRRCPTMLIVRQPGREGAVGALSAGGHLRRDRHRQPLGLRRGRRRGSSPAPRRWSRATCSRRLWPAAWSWSAGAARRPPRRRASSLPSLSDDGLNGRATAAGRARQEPLAGRPASAVRTGRPRPAPSCARTCASG